MRRAGGFGALLLVACTCAAPAAASVTVGELAPGAIVSCSNNFEFLQHSSPGGTHTMPAAGTVTSWTHRSQVGNGQTPTLKIYRKTADPATYSVVGSDGPHPIPANTTETFPASVPVQAGDVLGITGAGGAVNIGCKFSGTSGEVSHRMSNLAVGAFGDFTIGSPDERVNVRAVLEPTSTFTLGKAKRNRKKGTAAIVATLPNPGEVTVTGKSVRGSSAATISKVVAEAGPVTLTIRAKGKSRKKLNESGAAKVKAAISFTPVGGAAHTESRKLKLLKD